ncbi:bifunctional DNA primase/polymerase [Solihabitans fulvus]|uniref:bifunctional DNA primase/polymerase n=1 Tax=Solihabitans fulvus TaxID=1892852 RepID=UPI001CB762E2|nr:bifunctional DNA primase/polymerase [Solihabitans fulvus]
MAVSARARPANRLLRAALSAAERGWHVFPVCPRGKRPALRDWEHRATTDPDVVTAWWTSSPYNIGVATGPSCLVVVDLDASHGQQPPSEWAQLGVSHGREVFAVLAHRAAAPPSRTYTVATPTGGWHLYYAAPEYAAPDHAALRNTVGALGWHIDTRAGGGYVVAAGSVRDQGRYTVVDAGSVAPLPDWLRDALTPPPVIVRPRTPATHSRAYLRAILDGEAATVVRAAHGTRNQTLFKAAATLGRLVAGGALDEFTAVSTLRQAASVHLGVDDFTGGGGRAHHRVRAAPGRDGAALGRLRPPLDIVAVAGC